jgi:hypothetical protein
MEQTKSNFKITSILVLILAGLSLVQTVVMLAFGFANPGNVPEQAVLITKILVAVISLLLLLPQVYMGVRGLKLVKNPDPAANAHIIWAIILFVFSVLALISPVKALIGGADIGASISSIFNVLIEVLVFGEYIKYAKDLQKQAN